MVGQLRAAKAVDDLIRAFASGTDLSDRLTIVGEGPERPALKRLIAEHDLTGRVELMGAQPDPWDVVAGADAFVLPSRHEGMPNVVLEALALGTPVIATDDLTSLTTLATESPDGAVTIVARSDLGRAIREVRPILEGTVIPRASLLPQAHTLAAATERLLSLLETS
jgi:glycosyltransferase involved in cell wall biosynthesis